MKRETRSKLRRLLNVFHVGERTLLIDEVQDILNSDARQRAEIRDLRARLAAAAEGALYFGHPIRTRERREALDLAERATDLKNKNWRKP